MISMLGVLPIILTLMIIIIGTAGYWSMKERTGAVKRKSSSKKGFVFFKLYAVALIVSLVVYIIFPSSSGETLHDRDWEEGIEYEFYQVMYEEIPIKEIESLRKSDDTYPLEGSTLFMNHTSDDRFHDHVSVLIVKDPSMLDEFRVEVYQTRASYNEKDITPYYPKLNITAQNNYLTIHLPYEETELSMYDYSFPFKQFKGNLTRGFNSSIYAQSSSHLAIVYIPTDVEPQVDQLEHSGMYNIEVITKEE